MLKKSAAFLKRSRYIIIIILILCLTFIGGVFTLFMLKEGRANSDMLKYINEGNDSYEGLKFLKENFNIEGDAMFAVESVGEDEELKSIINDFGTLDGVEQIIWYGTLESFDYMVDSLSILIKLIGGNPDDFLDVDSLKNFLRTPMDNGEGYVYSVLIMHKFPPSSKEGSDILKHISDAVAPRPISFAGMTYTADTVMNDTVMELPYYMLFGIITIILVLLLTSTSLIEPLIIIFTLVVSLFINLGTNYFYPEVSVISLAVSSLIQLGCVLDFTVFFMHFVKKDNPDKKSALKLIAFSSITIALALVPLLLMNFGLGIDLAVTLTKAVILTALSVLVLVPSLFFVTKKLDKKFTRKKIINLNNGKLSKFVVKNRAIAALLGLILLTLGIIGQFDLNITHFQLFKEKENIAAHEIASNKLSNQLIVSTPILTLDNKSPQDCINKIESIEGVDKVLSIFSAIKLDGTVVEMVLDNNMLKDSKEFNAFFSMDENGTRYTLFTIILSGNADSQASVDAYNQIVDALDEYYGVSYRFGVVSAVSDMSKIVEYDFWLINLVGIVVIFLLALIFTSSLSASVIITTIIETAVLLPMSILAVFGQSINFFVLILMGAQFFSTTNYTFMLYSNFKMAKFDDERKRGEVALQNCFKPILTSALSYSATCFAVFFAAQNLIVKNMTLLLALNGFIGMLLTLFVAAPLLTYSKKLDFYKKLFTKRKNVI